MLTMENQMKNKWNENGLTLTELLRTGDNNYYAAALALSRNEIMNEELYLQLGKAVERDQKWLVVARRVIDKDYLRAYQFCINDDRLLQALIEAFFSQSKLSEFYQVHLRDLFNKILKSLHSGTLNSYFHLLMIKNTQLYLELALKNNQVLIIEELWKFFCGETQLLANILTQLNQINAQRFKNQSNQFIWDLHESSVKLFRDLIGMMETVEELAVKKMKVGHFHAFLKTNNNGKLSLQSLIEMNVISVVELLSTISIQQEGFHQLSGLQKIDPNLITLLKSQKVQKRIDYYSELCHTISTLSKLSFLQLWLAQNQRLLFLLASTTKIINIFTLNNYSDLSTEILAINDEISSHTFSDTLGGNYMRMIVTLCTNIGAFFHIYVRMLEEVFRNCNLGQMKSEDFIGYLLKVTLLADEALVVSRKHKIEKLMDLVNAVISPHWQFFDQLQQLQVLRYFMAFSGHLGRFMSESAQSLLSKCISLCFQCLSTPSGSPSKRYLSQLSQIQQHCLNILQILPEQPSTLSLIKKSLLPTVLTQFLKQSDPSPSLLDLFHTYMTQIPEMISRSSQFIIDYLYTIFMADLKQGRKGTQRAIKVIGILCTIVETQGDLRFQDVQGKIVEPILTNLCQPYAIQFQEELLNLLELLLTKHFHLTPNICLVISKLPQLYQKNHKKLSILRNIYKALANSPQIRNEILYEYPDIISIMIGMFVDYVQTVLSEEEFMYYQGEVRTLLWSVQLFLNKYGERVIEESVLHDMVGVRLFESLCTRIQKVNVLVQMKKNSPHNPSIASTMSIYFQYQQLLLQLCFTLSQLFLSPQAQPPTTKILPTTITLLNSIPAVQYLYFETVKMIPVLLINQLFSNGDNHETIVSDMVKYCQYMGKMEIQWGISKQWGNIEGVGDWDLWPARVREYVGNVLREMRNRKVIDQVDHAQYIQSIDKVLN